MYISLVTVLPYCIGLFNPWFFLYFVWTKSWIHFKMLEIKCKVFDIDNICKLLHYNSEGSSISSKIFRLTLALSVNRSFYYFCWLRYKVR
jgi:hypothetical protein